MKGVDAGMSLRKIGDPEKASNKGGRKAARHPKRS